MQAFLQAQLEAERARQTYAVVTIARASGSVPRTSGKMLVFSDGRSLGTVGGGPAERFAAQQALSAISAGQNVFLPYSLPASFEGGNPAGTLDFLIEVFHPKPLLVIFGAGHVGKSLMQLAKLSGFSVLLLDDRPESAIQDAVNLADRFIPLSDIERDMLACGIPEGAFIVLCGHDHEVDYHALAAALQLRPRYLGMLASRWKIDTLFQKLKARGFSSEALSLVHTPIGLDLGGESPQELAVGILAEILCVKNGKSP